MRQWPSPPFLHPCYYGTDIDSQENLIACHYSVSDTVQIIGADSLGYLPVSELGALVGNTRYCSACFDGNYPTEIPTDTKKNRFEQKLSNKVSSRTTFHIAFSKLSAGAVNVPPHLPSYSYVYSIVY